MRSCTTSVSRSICSSEMRASSRTHSSELVARISSSRMDSAVRGVRSWWEASEASRLSASSRSLSMAPERASSSATSSISAIPEGHQGPRERPAPISSARRERRASGSEMRWACHSATETPIDSAARPATVISTQALAVWARTSERGIDTETDWPEAPVVRLEIGLAPGGSPAVKTSSSCSTSIAMFRSVCASTRRCSMTSSSSPPSCRRVSVSMRT